MSKIPSALMATVLLVGCASSPPVLTAQQRLDLYRQNAGAPVASFRLDNFMGVRSWTPLGDQTLAVWTTGNRGYLLELWGRCFGLSTAPRIDITNSMSQIVTRFDSVVPLPQTGVRLVGSRSCRIQSIRTLDASAIRDAKRELRDAALIERSAAPPEGYEDRQPDGS